MINIPSKLKQTALPPKASPMRHGLHEVLFSSYPEVLGVEAVADILGIHPNSVRALIKQHQIPAKKVGMKWAVLREDLKIWMLDPSN